MPITTKACIALISSAPALLTIVVIAYLVGSLEAGASQRAWEEARQIHPRAVPLEAWPMLIGLLTGLFLFSPYYDRLLSSLPMPSSTRAEDSNKISWAATRREPHPLESYVKQMFISHKSRSGEAVNLSSIPSYANSPVHVKRMFYKAFLGTDLWVITRRNTGSKELSPKDIYYALGTAIVAESEDCLHYHSDISKKPVKRVKATYLLSILAEDASLLISQPSIMLEIDSDVLVKIKSAREKS